MKYLFFVTLLFYNYSFGQDIDTFFGNYSDKDSLISFCFSENGINNLRIKQNEIPENIVTYDLLGIFGETLLLDIKYEKENSLNIIKCCIVVSEGRFIISSGYYYSVSLKKSKENSKKILTKFVFELSRK